MANTYTSNFISVSDADTTTHDPQALASTSEPINVLDARIKWEGSFGASEARYDFVNDITTQSQLTNLFDVYGAVLTEDANYARNGLKVGDSNTFGGIMSKEVVPTREGTSASTDFNTPTDNADVFSIYMNVNPEDGPKSNFDDYITGNSSFYRIQYKYNNFDGDAGDKADFILERYENGTQTHRSVSTYEGGATNSDYIGFVEYTEDRLQANMHSLSTPDAISEDGLGAADQGFPTVSITDTSSTDLRLQDGYTGYRTAQGFDQHISGFYKTDRMLNPSVSQDATGTYQGTLGDEVGPYRPLQNFGSSKQTLTHQIGGSGSGRFKFSFDWEIDIPAPANGTLAFYDSSENEWKEVAVADISDYRLQYNHVAVYNEQTGSWGALDVVDATDPDAVEQYAFYDDTNGWLAPRQIGTTSG